MAGRLGDMTRSLTDHCRIEDVATGRVKGLTEEEFRAALG